MSKVKSTYNTDENRETERAESKKRKEEETRSKKEGYAEITQRAEENRLKAEEAIKKNAKKKGNSNLSYHIMFAVLGAMCLYVIAMMFLNQAPPLNKVPVIDEKRIAEHNSNFQWKQGANDFFEGTTLADAKKLMNAGFSSHQNLSKCSSDDSLTPPESFHYREAFANCVLPTTNMTKSCGASYAFALSQTLAERNCISNRLEKATPLSAQELVKCDILNNGCKNGHLNIALDHMKTKGLVDEECLPYKPEAEKCEGMCDTPKRVRIDNYCLLIGEDDIKRDIMKNGPVVSTSHVFVDLLNYKSGVYTKGDEVARFSGQTAVRIVGWGTESGSDNEQNKGNKYWIVQTTWGKTWGDDGFAKVSFGQELFFDQYAYSLKLRTERPQATQQAKAETAEVNANAGIAEEQNVNLDLDDVAQ